MNNDKLTNANNATIGFNGNSKYKNHIMEKYLRGLDCTNSNNNNTTNNKDGSKVELSKWIESAANFTPDKNNYIEWDTVRYILQLKDSIYLFPLNFQIIKKKTIFRNKTNGKCRQTNGEIGNHQKEELEAAEALTSLAGNYRNRMIITTIDKNTNNANE